MVQPLCWLLLADEVGVGRSAVLRLSYEAAFGAREHQLSVDLASPRNSQLRESAQAGASAAYRLLWNERLHTRSIDLVFAVDGAEGWQVSGRSATLAFALSFAVGTLPTAPGAPGYRRFAATGMLDFAGRVLAVEGVPAKVAAGIDAVGAGGIVFLPLANMAQVPVELQVHARARGVELHPVERLDEALLVLGIPLSHIYLDSPFRGLDAFEYRHRSIFFGRQQEVVQLCDQLERRAAAQQPAVAVIGPSGSGKSSFIQAGVVPELERRFRLQGIPLDWVLWRPREAAATKAGSAALTDSLVLSFRRHLAELREAELDFEPERLAGQLLARQPQGRRLLLVVDQAEELFTEAFGDTDLSALGSLLQQLQRHGVFILCTLKIEFFARWQSHPSIGEPFAIDGYFTLGRMARNQLLRLIEQPVEALDYRFEPEPASGVPLSHQIVEDCPADTDPLPLLQFTLARLFDERDQGRRLLLWDSYRRMQGLQGAITKHAEEVYGKLPDELKREFPWLMRQLVTFVSVDSAGADRERGDNHAAVERPSPRSFLIAAAAGPSASARHRLVSVLSGPDARLLLADNVADGRVQVRVAHEALLHQWHRAAEEIERNKGDIVLAGALRNDASAWQREREDNLWRGPRLRRGRKLVKRLGNELDADMIAFVDAAVRRGKRRVQWNLAGVLVIALAAGIVLIKQQDRQAQLELSRKLTTQIDVMLAGSAPWDDEVALLRAIAAHRVDAAAGNRSATYRVLGAVAQRTTHLRQVVHLDADINAWTFSESDPDALLILANDQVHCWSIRNRKLRWVAPVRFSLSEPDRRYRLAAEDLSSGDSDDDILLDEAQAMVDHFSRDLFAPLPDRSLPEASAPLLIGGHSIAQIPADMSRVRDLKPEHVRVEHLSTGDVKTYPIVVSDYAPTHDANLVVLDYHGRLTFVDLARGSTSVVGKVDGYVSSLRMHPEHDLVAAQQGRRILLWSLETQAFTQPPGMHDALALQAAAISGGNSQAEREALDDCAHPSLHVPLNDHQPELLCLSFRGNMRLLELAHSIEEDWPPSWTGRERWHLTGVREFVVSPTQNHVAAWMQDGSVALLERATGRLLYRSPEPFRTAARQNFIDLRFSGNGNKLAVWFEGVGGATEPSTVVVWTLAKDGVASMSVIRGYHVPGIALRDQPESLVLAEGRELVVWSLRQERELQRIKLDEFDSVSAIATGASNAMVVGIGRQRALVLHGDKLENRVELRLGEGSFVPQEFRFLGASGYLAAYDSRDYGPLLIFDSTDGTLVQETGLGAHSAIVAVSGDNKYAFLAHSSSTLHMQAIPILDGLLDHLCRVAGRELSQNEWRNWISAELPPQPLCPTRPAA